MLCLGALDLRGLAGSLESLNSIGGDSALVPSQGDAATGDFSKQYTNRDYAYDDNRNGAADPFKAAAVHNSSSRRSSDMSINGRRSRFVSFDQSISEIPVDASRFNSDAIASRGTDASGNTATRTDSSVNGGTVTNGYVDHVRSDSAGNKSSTLAVNASVVEYLEGSLPRSDRRSTLSRSPLQSTSSLDFSPTMEQVSFDGKLN